MRCIARLGILGLAAVLGSSFPNVGWCGDAPSVSGGDAAGRTAVAFVSGGAWKDLSWFGGLPDDHRGVAILSLELRHTLKATDGFTLDYVMAVVPVELQTGILVEDSPRAQGPGLGRESVYGAGFDPVGFGVRLGRGVWRPFATVRGGMRIFQRPVPDPQSTRYNFSADLGLGVLRRVAHSSWVSVSVDFHHVSNGGMAEANRGINQIVLNVGFVRGR